MTYQIPDEILNLYIEMEAAFSDAVSSNDTETANRFERQLSNMAMSQMDKFVADRKIH